MLERPYSYKPAPRFFGDGPAYLGMELEVEAPDLDKKREGLGLASPNWAYAKRDGSLGATGWEMVTHPICMKFFLTRENVRDYHDILPGTVLMGRYKGATITATALAGGRFERNGVEYRSMTALMHGCAEGGAGGIRANGYKFFGLITAGAPNPVVSFFALVAQLKAIGYTSHENGRCGFHLHVSRAAFSADRTLDNPTFYRFKCLINGDLFRRLSQRGTTAGAFRYCEQVPVTRDNFAWNSSRYQAVNITSKTVEVRIFRGNLREDRLRKNIEAVVAALEFAREAASYDAPTDAEFTAWVNERGERFPNLKAYIAQVSPAHPAATETEVQPCA